MKTIIVATGLSLAAFGAAPASAAPSWMTYNREMTHACYDAATLRQSPDGIKTCNSAIIMETTTGGDERMANLVNRGILLLLANKNADAGRDFDEALSLDPRQPEALLGKAIEQWQSGNSAAAATLASQSLQYGPRRPAVAYLIRGLANEQQGQLRAAYQDLQTAQRLEPGWEEPALQLQRYHVVNR
jgi:tetratricopeptide (TPR) repeat protein